MSTDERVALARGDDPYDTEVARKAAALELLDDDDREVAERRQRVMRYLAVGKPMHQIAELVGVSRAVVREDAKVIKEANKRRFSQAAPKEIAAQFEAGHDYVIARAVEMAERARKDGELPEPEEFDHPAIQVEYLKRKAETEEREREALRLISKGLNDKAAVLVKCGILRESTEPTEEERKREQERTKLGEQSKDLIVEALLAHLQQPSRPVPVDVKVIEHAEAKGGDSA